MKKCLILLVMMLTVAVTALAGESKQVRGERKRARRDAQVKAGVLEKVVPGKVFRILDVSEALPNAVVDNLTKSIRQMCLVPLEIVHEKKSDVCPFEKVEKLLSQDNVGAGVVIVSDPKLPILLVSPDRYWTILNVAPLQADNPAQDLFMRRFAKTYWGAVARTLGAGLSSYAGCVLAPFRDVKQLDAIVATAPCPESYNKMHEGAKAAGINMIRLATYRTACQEGWAPSPTNEAQKAVWDEVHKLPTEPIKIEPETKKVEK